MANTYTEVGADEMTSFLKAIDSDYEEVDRRRTKERVFDLPTAHEDLTVRVFSTLDNRKANGGARDCGKDAIRTVLWSESAEKPVDGRPHTKRIDTWRKNLRRKVDELLAEAKERAQADEQAEDEASAVARDLPHAEGADDEIVAQGVIDTQYGKKVALDSPYEAKDDIKSLDWERTHRAWEDDAWQVDADELEYVREHLAEQGWTLCRPPATDDSLDLSSALDGLRQGDRVVVHYYGKNNGNELSKEGEVGQVRDERMTFQRDDGQRMFVQPDKHDDEPGLFTAGSHAPYVGEVYEVEQA